jgi:hypothetical protein
MSQVADERPTVAESIARLAAAASSLEPSELQRLLTLVTRAYAERIIEQHGSAPFPPYAAGAEVTATETLVVVGEMLRASEISSFELASMLNI